MDIKAILKMCDHTLLRVDCTSKEIKTLCDQAIKHECASVCIPPCHVAGAKRYVGDKLRICTVIGFPNGYMTTAAKAFETADAVKNGADEIDMVINLSMVKDGCWDDVLADIKAVRQACVGKVLKVIIECCLLTEEEKIRMCSIVAEGGADFIKTSTGFSKGGATRSDVALLRKYSPRECAGQGSRRYLLDRGRRGLHLARSNETRHEPHREACRGAGGLSQQLSQSAAQV